MDRSYKIHSTYQLRNWFEKKETENNECGIKRRNDFESIKRNDINFFIEKFVKGALIQPLTKVSCRKKYLVNDVSDVTQPICYIRMSCSYASKNGKFNICTTDYIENFETLW